MLLALRLGVVALLLLAALGPSLPLGPVRTVVLLDQSPSVRQAVWKVGPELYLPGARYVAFASGAVSVAAPTARRLDLGEGTRLQEAIRQALELRPDRIVLVSDGLFQDSPLPPPVPLYALYQPPSPNLSLALLGPTLPLRGEMVEVRAVLEATAPIQARLTLEGPAGRLERVLSLEPGRRSLGYRFSLEGPSVVSAWVESPLGREEARLELTPSDATRVWVLGDAALARYLKAQGFVVEERKEITLPIQAEVVALGVGVKDLSPAELDALGSFLQQGGSLLWTATSRGLFFGGWERSSLADSLPLEPVEEPGGVGIVLVLDVSGSMLEADKLGLAVVGALELVRSARPQDYIGVVLFSDRPRWLFRPRPMTEQGRKEAESLLLSVRAGGGTMIRRAYLEALEALEGVPTDSKQVIALTDGLAADVTPDLFDAARDASPRIKTSTVAIGADADRQFLQELARAGGGAFWDVPSPQDLPRFFLEEAQRAFRREALEGRFPVGVGLHPIARGASPPPLPVLLPAKAKPWAQAVLTSGGGGAGGGGERTGAGGRPGHRPSRSWKDWPGVPGLLGSRCAGLPRPRPAPGCRRCGSLGVRVVLEGQFERPRLRVGGLEQPLAPVGPLRYEARLPGRCWERRWFWKTGGPAYALPCPACPSGGWRMAGRT